MKGDAKKPHPGQFQKGGRKGKPYKKGERGSVGRPWPKGVSGNPNGRPPQAEAFRALIEQEMARVIVVNEVVTVDGKPVNKTLRAAQREILVKMMIRQAIAGDGYARRHLLDRWLGREPMPLIHEGGDVPIHHDHAVSPADIARVLKEEMEKRTKRQANDGHKGKA